MKKVWYMLVVLLVLGVVACSATNEPVEAASEEKTETEVPAEKTDVESTNETEEQVFNAETLSTFNGKDGQPAYVAVDGIVYDVTDVKAWQSPHAGKFEPGKDYSDEIGKSPHGTNKLKGLTKVGTYEE